MFVKLLKHEWRASRGLVGLLCAVIGLSGLLSGGALRSMVWSVIHEYSGMLSVYTTVLVISALAIPVCCVLSMYLLMYRFYKSRFTDQGYLLLTLPVSTHQQMLSCIVNTVMGVALISIVALISACVAVSGYLSIFEQEAVKELSDQMAVAGKEVLGRLRFTSGNVAFQILYMLISFLADLLFFMTALTVGAQFAKRPVFYGILTYIGLNELASLADSLLEKWITTPVLTYAASCLLYAILAAAAYFVTYFILDRMLNLQ